jgi:hypothetical protein
MAKSIRTNPLAAEFATFDARWPRLVTSTGTLPVRGAHF